MNRFLPVFLVAVVSVSMVGCADYGGSMSKESIGGITGAVVGGALGSRVGRGDGRGAATVAGAIIGAMIGSSVGRSLDAQDEARAQQVLEQNRTGQASSWVNPDSGAQVTVVPTQTYQNPTGQYCREYQTTVVVGGKRENAYGRACRQPDGSWQVVN